jgi:predicted aspartyl protease
MTTRAWRVLTGAGFLFSAVVPAPAAAAAPSAAPASATADPRAWPATYEPASIEAADLLAAAKRATSATQLGKTLRLEYAFRDGGLTGTRREMWDGENYRIDSTVGPFVTAWGRHGDQRWETNENGYTLLQRGIHKRGEANARAVAKADPAAVKVLGRLRAPADVVVLSVAPADGRPERRFYDATTMRIVRREVTYLNRLIVETFEDYRTVDGVTLPFKTTLSDGRPDNDETDTLTAIKVGDPIGASELAVPPSRRMPVALPEGVRSVRLPARIERDGHIIVRLIVKGRGLDFQLDSGAVGIVLNKDVAAQLGLPTYGRWSQTVAGTFSSARTVVPRIDIGAVSMTDVTVELLPFAQQQDFDTKVVGLLGYDFIAGCVVKIDYANGRVDAIPYSQFQPPPDGAILDATLDDGVPMIALKMNNAVGPRFILDTGADDVVAFSGFAKAHAADLDDHSPQKIASRFFNLVTAQGVGGTLRMHATMLDRIQLGDVLYRDWIVFVLQKDQAEFEGEDADGLAGAAILRAFDVYLDYASSRVVLVPNKHTRKANDRDLK